MSEEKSSEPTKAILKAITDIGVYVAALIFYLAAIRGVADTPYPKTTSFLTILGTSIVIVSWRWSQLKQKKGTSPGGGLLVVGGWEPPRQTSKLQQFLDPLRRSSRENYVLPILRRQIEGGILCSLVLFTLGWAGLHLRDAIDEWSKDPSRTCSPFNTYDRSMILIANLLQTSAQPELLVSDKIYEALVNQQAEGQFDICRLQEPIQLNTIALEASKKYNADLVIWGRSDVIYEIHLEAPRLDNPDRTLSALSSAEAASVEFQFKEPTHIAYVTQFALSEILMLNGQIVEAQTRLEDLVAEARQAGMDGTHPEDLADGYFLLGIFYHPYFSAHADEQKSLDAFKNAMDLNPKLFGAWFNHGLILMNLGRTDEAMTDFTYLIDNDTPFKASAYVQRAQLQEDPEAILSDLDAAVALDPGEGYYYRGLFRLYQGEYQAAIKDFEQAVAFDPSDTISYYLLGKAQLLDGQTEAAKQTYVRIVPYLDEASRKEVIGYLQEDAKDSPEIKDSIEEIIRDLEAAQLPK